MNSLCVSQKYCCKGIIEYKKFNRRKIIRSSIQEPKTLDIFKIIAQIFVLALQPNYATLTSLQLVLLLLLKYLFDASVNSVSPNFNMS